MIRCAFAIPGDLSTPTGGYTYARKILPLLAESMDTSVCALPGGFPFPSADELKASGAALQAADGPDCIFLFDGLAYGALPAEFILRLRGGIVALIHHPLGLEEGLRPEEKRTLLQTEGASLSLARHIIVPSAATAAVLSQLFGIASGKITVAEPGVLRGPRARGLGAGEIPHIVSVGAVTPRKGFDVLADALYIVRDLEWHATIAGSLDRSPESVALLKSKIAGYGLENRVQLTGSMDEGAISALYASGDIFALASHYEGYGMVFAEAMAHGLPVVASGEGAVADTVPRAAGLVCSPGDPEAFADGLRRMLTDEPFRREKADGAWRHGQTLPNWPAAAHTIADVLRKAMA